MKRAVLTFLAASLVVGGMTVGGGSVRPASASDPDVRLGAALALSRTEAVVHGSTGADGVAELTLPAAAGDLQVVVTATAPLDVRVVGDAGQVLGAASATSSATLTVAQRDGARSVVLSGPPTAPFSLRATVLGAPEPSPTPASTPAPGASPAPVPSTAQPTAPTPVGTPPPAGGYFDLKPPGAWSSLPSDAEAAAMVRRSSWEPRPQNATANRTVPSAVALGAHGGVEARWNDWLLPRVTGAFTGTTDEIVQWAAAKWGLPDELLRGQLATESWWYQGLRDSAGRPVAGKGFGDYTGDSSKCPPGHAAPCPLSFGVLQIKYASYHPGTFPSSAASTAFNVDYAAAVLRGCYEGWESWLRDYGSATGGATTYRAGDLDGCLGRWYAGQWHTADADGYAASVRRNARDRVWAQPGF